MIVNKNDQFAHLSQRPSQPLATQSPTVLEAAAESFLKHPTTAQSFYGPS